MIACSRTLSVRWMHMPLRAAPLSLCFILGACAFRPPWAKPSLAADLALDSLVLATAIQYGIGATGIDVPLVCVSLSQVDPRPELLALVQKSRVSVLRPGSACHVDTTGGPLTGRSLVAERSGGALRGISVNVGPRAVAADGSVSFSVELRRIKRVPELRRQVQRQ